MLTAVLAIRAGDRRTTQGLALYTTLLFSLAMAIVVADFYFRWTKNALRGFRVKPPNVNAPKGADWAE